MKINYRKADAGILEGEALVYFFSSEQLTQRDQYPMSKLPAHADIKDELYSSTVIYNGDKFKRYLFMCLGKDEKMDKEKLRRAAGKITDKLKDINVMDAVVMLRPIQGMNTLTVIESLSEGFQLANYQFDRYKSEQKTKPITKIDIVSMENLAENEVKRILDRSEIVCRNTNMVRDLVNETSYETNIDKLGDYYYYGGKKLKMKARMIEQKELGKLGMNLLLAVNRGSETGAKLIILEYFNGPKNQPPIAIVGKGVCFDTGGINLKPSGWLEEMRMDMAGGATAFGIIKTAAELNLPLNIVAAMPLVENAIDAKSYKPGDIFKAYNGKFVEISNTDAEGRLILADTLSFVEEKYNPKEIINFATLTGSIMITFGYHIAGLFTNDEAHALGDALFSSGQETYELLWRLPVYDEFKEEMKSDIADYRSLGAKQGRYGGAVSAAAFLQFFVKKTPFAHIDIAGTAWLDKKKEYIPKYATGYGVRLVTNYLESIALKGGNGTA